VIDFHSHLVPGVDDGASDLEQSRAALAVMRDQGIRALVTTPHIQASLVSQPAELEAYLGRVDHAFAQLQALARADFPDLRVERGHEVMLDTPAPDVSDPRLRLAGTSFVLVEFPYMTVPPGAAQVLFELKLAGWQPVIAHPERYANVETDLSGCEEWRRVGGLLQVNGGSLLGRYGKPAQDVAWHLLRRGMADYLSSDFHARGTLHAAGVRDALEREGGAEQARLLMNENPARLLEGKPPRPVPPLERPRSLWRRLAGRFRAP
jgi:protein-tyrosine phosphatase